MRISITLLLALTWLASACRTPGGSDLSEQEDTALFRKDFDWGKLVGGHLVEAERVLRFCFDENLPEALRLPFIHAATKINKAGVPVYQRWQLLAFGEPPYLCDKDWDPQPAPGADQAHLRIKAGEQWSVPSKIGFQPYKIDFDSSLTQDAAAKAEAEFIVPQTGASTSNQLATFTFHRSIDDPGYVFAGQITVNALPDETEEKLEWTTEFGNLAANNSFDPMLLAMHMLGHAIRLEHDESLFPGIQKLACGSLQDDAISPAAITASPGSPLEIKPKGDDQPSADKLSIEVGENGIVESSKSIPVMFPFLRLGSHCRNPGKDPASQLTERFHFTEKETEAIKASAKHQTAPAGD